MLIFILGQQSNSNSSILSYFSELSTDTSSQSQHNIRNNTTNRYNNDSNSNRDTFNNNRDTYNRNNTYSTNNRTDNNDENQIVCMCGVDARLLTVRKEGPNKGWCSLLLLLCLSFLNVLSSLFWRRPLGDECIVNAAFSRFYWLYNFLLLF